MKTKQNEEYLKWYHNVFYPRICAQIRTCEIELQSYNEFKVAVEGLKADLEECAGLLKSIYGNAKEGISCSDFNDAIENINVHGSSLNTWIGEIDKVIGLIDNKTKEINDEISSLRSQLRF